MPATRKWHGAWNSISLDWIAGLESKTCVESHSAQAQFCSTPGHLQSLHSVADHHVNRQVNRESRPTAPDAARLTGPTTSITRSPASRHLLKLASRTRLPTPYCSCGL